MLSCSLNQSAKRWGSGLSPWSDATYKVGTTNRGGHPIDGGYRERPDTSEALSILLIDDEPVIRQLLHQALATQGHRLYEANDGATGLVQFQTLQPDLILLDINMPGMDGFTILREIRHYDVTVGIIMVSGQSAKGLIAKAFLSGADQYLIKPLRLQLVFDEVKRVSTLVRWRRYRL